MRDVGGSQDHYYLLKDLYTVTGLAGSTVALEEAYVAIFLFCFIVSIGSMTTGRSFDKALACLKLSLENGFVVPVRWPYGAWWFWRVLHRYL